jgi:CRP-like cAMP-binding protein
MANDELTSIPWLAICTARERAAIRKQVDFVDVRRGTVLVSEGTTPRWFYALVDGHASVQTAGQAPRRLGPGEPLNELDVLRNEMAAATVTLESDARLLVMGRREFLGVLDETPGVARRLLMRHIPAEEPRTARRPVLVPVPAA